MVRKHEEEIFSEVPNYSNQSTKGIDIQSAGNYKKSTHSENIWKAKLIF
jgi:hypothetical protein